MNNTELENRVKDAYSGLAPDLLPDILADCEKQNGTVIPMRRTDDAAMEAAERKGDAAKETERNRDAAETAERKRVTAEASERKKSAGGFAWRRWLGGIAAALVLFVGGFAGLNGYRAANGVASRITLDVNPSIEITVNANEKVLAVTPLNPDAEKIVGTMDFKGSSLDVAVNALIGSLVRNGYLSEVKNSILVSVDAKNEADGKSLEERLMNEINAILADSNIEGAILGQTLSKNAEESTKQLAAEQNITPGKAALVHAIATKSDRYSEEELAALTIQELMLISGLSSTQESLTAFDSFQTTGQASSAAYIGRDAAIKAALANAGLAETAVYDLECELDWEYGRMVYEVSFDTAEYEYEYDIDATTGAVVKVDRERADGRGSGSATGNGTTQTNGANGLSGGVGAATGGNGGSASGSQTSGAVSGQTGSNVSGQTDSTAYIGRDAAKNAALAHAGFTASEVRDLDCEFEREAGRAVYEVDFEAGGYEYDYDVDALTGEVLRFGREAENDRDGD